MQIYFFCPRWGSENIDWFAFSKKVKEAGYHGIEAAIPFVEKEKDLMIGAVRDHGLLLVAQYYQSFEKDFNEHINNFRRYLDHYIRAKPYLINCQTGKDYFSIEQNGLLFQLAKDLEQSSGIPVCHETHRNKALFSTHLSAGLLERFPFVRITADFSHWCCVSESLLADQAESMQLACGRADHIHARVGYPEGPQVNDPRAPEWGSALHAHLVWWDKIVQRHRLQKSPSLSITTEFGPPPYLPTLPYSNKPVADQWEINLHMKQLLQERYAPKQKGF